MAPVGVLQDPGLVHFSDTVIVVHPPHVLGVVLDETVVVSTFARTLMNAHSVQVVRHLLKCTILVLEPPFVRAYLLFKASYLVFDLVSLRV